MSPRSNPNLTPAYEPIDEIHHIEMSHVVRKFGELAVVAAHTTGALVSGLTRAMIESVRKD